MKHIESIRIFGFKKFKEFSASFNEGLNIIVGENESGKSTLLEAIGIVLNQTLRNSDKNALENFFNKDHIDAFNKKPRIENLPKIYIEITLALDDDLLAEEFSGPYFLNKKREDSDRFGIIFRCELDEGIANELIVDINNGHIPYEYYTLTWTTFKNFPYIIKHKPIRILLVDASNTTLSYDAYSKSVFLSKYGSGSDVGPKYSFSKSVRESFATISLDPIDEQRTFGINPRKISLENVIAIKDGEVLLENKGSGAASITKVDLAMSKSVNSDVVLIEEPENHLSHTTLRKMLASIRNNMNDKQLFITTHNDLIVSNFDLRNVCWINDDSSSLVRLHNLPGNGTEKYFIKLENHNLLQFILAKKVILVEGPTEALVIPYLFEKEYGGSRLDSSEIDVISCNGLSYQRYLDVAKSMGKKVAVITDNDGSGDKISECEATLSDEMQRVFTDGDVTMFTWEKCIYELNKNNSEFTSLIKLSKGSQYVIKGQENEPIHVRYMQLHKVEFSYQLIESKQSIQIPQYIKDAFEWIKS